MRSVRNMIVAAAIPAAVLTSGAAARSTRSDRTPLVMQGDYPVVTVYLGQRAEPHRFIVDTAAGATVLDRPLAARFAGGRPRADRNVQGASGGATAYGGARLDRLRVAGRTITGLAIVTTDMARFGNGNQRYDGILGNDVLSRYAYIFDVPGGGLTLLDRDRPDATRWNQCLLNPLAGRPGAPRGFVLVPIDLRAGSTALGIVDTGAAATVLNWAAADAAGLRRGGEGVTPDRPVAGFDPKAGTASSRAVIRGAAINGVALPPAGVRLSDLPVFEPFGLKDKPGLILGVNVLRAVPFAVTRNAGAFCQQPPAAG